MRDQMVGAALNGNLKAVHTLLNAGASVNTPGTSGHSPLIAAVQGDHLNIAQYLILNGAFINYQNQVTHQTALNVACMLGNTVIVDYLIKMGANKELGCIRPLMDAAIEGNVETVKYLLETANVEVDSRTHNGYTALSYACENGHTDIVGALLSKGANIENRSIRGLTPLMIAHNNGHKETVSYLLSRGAPKVLQPQPYYIMCE